MLHSPKGLDNEQSFAAVEPRLAEVDHLLCFNQRCDPTEKNKDFNLVWQNDAANGFPKIYKVLD